MAMESLLAQLCEQIKEAEATGRSVIVCGGRTKNFYGATRLHDEPGDYMVLDMSGYAGIVNYEPSELVITARAGTLLSDIERALDERGQMLAFEPPRLGPSSTLGGCIAAGLSGPRRMAAGSARDFVLGSRLLDSSGKVLRFGGEVMKNVAGYDVSRLLAGSMGIFGVMTEISLKVSPRPLSEATVEFAMSRNQALERFNLWRCQPLPISATAWVARDGGVDGRLSVRFSGNPAAVSQAVQRLGGEVADDAKAQEFWSSLRDQTHSFFTARPLWRVAVPPAAVALEQGSTLIEWGGGQRWVTGVESARELRSAVTRAGGHAALFRYDSAPEGVPVFQPLPAALHALSRRLKQQLDPAGLFNPKRLFPDF